MPKSAHFYLPLTDRSATKLRGQNGEQFTFTCSPDGNFNKVWGTVIYTDDSSICSAAVHAGMITLLSGGTVTIEIRQGQQSYKGSTRNGVTSANWGSWSGSFVFVKIKKTGSDPSPVTGTSPAPGGVPPSSGASPSGAPTAGGVQGIDWNKPWLDWRVQNCVRRYLRERVLSMENEERRRNGQPLFTNIDEWGRFLNRNITTHGKVDGPWENPTHFVWYQYNRDESRRKYGLTVEEWVRKFCMPGMPGGGGTGTPPVPGGAPPSGSVPAGGAKSIPWNDRL